MKKFIALCMIIMATLSVSAKTIKEFVVTTLPQMSCQNCENKIKKNLRFEKGVTNIQTDLENQVVVVTYDADKTNEANLTKAFAKLDYNVAPTSKAGSSAAVKCGKANTCDKSCDKAKAADKKCDKGKACDRNVEKKCTGDCKNGSCKKGEGDCCKNKK